MPSWTCERALHPCSVRFCAASQAILPAGIATSPSPSLSPSCHFPQRSALLYTCLYTCLYSLLFCVAVTDCLSRVEPVRLSRYLFPLLLANFAVALSPSLCQRKAPRRDENVKSQHTDPSFTLQATTPTVRRSPSSPSRPSTRPPPAPPSAMSSLRPPRPL